MNVGELFLNLGIKGSDKTIGAITDVKKGLGGIASESLAAKAGIVGAMYALERLFSISGKAGTGLTNLNAVLGASLSKTVQQYQGAGRLMGVANEEIAGTFKSLQTLMTKTLMGEGAPKGMARLALLTGGLTPSQQKAISNGHSEILIQKLQEYAQKERNAGLRNETLRSFGYSDNMIAASVRGGFNSTALKNAPAYSEPELRQLDRANIAWSVLGNNIEMAVGRFNAMHGLDIVNDFDKIINSTIRLAESFEKVADKVHLFEGISEIVSGIADSMEIVSEVIDKISGKDLKKGDLLYTAPGGDSFSQWLGKGFLNAIGAGSESEDKPLSKTDLEATLSSSMNGQNSKLPSDSDQLVDSAFSAKAEKQFSSLSRLRHSAPALPSAKSIAAPKLSGPASNTNTQTVNVNQTNNFDHGGTDPIKVADLHKKSIAHAVRTIPLSEGP